MVWKTVAVILDRCFTASTTYHNFLHRLRSDSGTGTVTLEVKLIQKVTAIREEFLHTIFLYILKAYDALDRSRCLDIREVYVMGSRDLCLLCRYWKRLQMMARDRRYYREPFKLGRGVAQGDPLLHTVFNMVVETMVCHWESLVAKKL